MIEFVHYPSLKNYDSKHGDIEKNLLMKGLLLRMLYYFV